jgi:SAM-dependent methyltransferase
LLSKRIGTRKPAAYLTREAWLQGVPFYVDERAIVPRSLIGELLAHPELGGGIDPWLGAHTARVLDLCTGNGSLAVLAAMVYPDVTVDAADISADALAVARINVDRHALQDRIRLIESDSPGVGPGPLRPDPLQPALRQCWQHGRPARRIPGRALLGACGRRRRHGLRPPAAARGRLRIFSRRACWSWKSAMNAAISNPHSRRWKPSGWIPAQATTRSCC